MQELTELRWVPDTQVTRKVKRVFDEKEGKILVEMPLKVCEYDNHEEHIKNHGKKLKVSQSNEEVYQLLLHIRSHHIALEKKLGEEAAKWQLPKTNTKPSEPSDPSTNTKGRVDSEK